MIERVFRATDFDSGHTLASAEALLNRWHTEAPTKEQQITVALAIGLLPFMKSDQIDLAVHQTALALGILKSLHLGAYKPGAAA